MRERKDRKCKSKSKRHTEKTLRNIQKFIEEGQRI